MRCRPMSRSSKLISKVVRGQRTRHFVLHPALYYQIQNFVRTHRCRVCSMILRSKDAADEKQPQILGAKPGSEAIKERVVSSTLYGLTVHSIR